MSFSKWDRYHYPWCKAERRDIRISLRETFREIQVHSSSKMLLAWAKPHQQSSAFYQQSRNILCRRNELCCRKEFCWYNPFLYTQGIHLVSSVSPGLTHFLYAFDKCDCASRSVQSSCIACPGKPRAEPTINPRLPDPPGSLLATVITRGNVGNPRKTSGWKHL